MMYGYGIGISPNNRLFGGGGGGNPLWDGLLAYYTADNTPNDATGNGKDLTLINGTTYGTGIINQGFSFDGVNDYAQYVGDVGVTGDLTLSTWVYINSATNTSILQTYNYSSALSMSFFIGSSGLIRLYAQNSSGSTTTSTFNSAYSTGVWNHIVFTWNETTKKVNLYVNDSLHPSSGVNTHTDCSSSGFSTGIILSKRDFYLNGLQDEIGVWNRVITPTEVTELYNSGSALQYS